MLLNKKIIVFILLCFSLQSIYAQSDTLKDKRKTRKDSTEIYNRIRNYSKKNKFTKTLHKLIFRAKKPRKKDEIHVSNDTTNFDGKIIRKINIITLDP
ncbi:MAG: hypothetical protein RSD30_18305, partial [Flavobacterium sp.]